MNHELEDDEIPVNFRREAALAAMKIIYPATVHATEAQNRKIGLAQIAFALGIEERSMRDVAAELKVSVACISKGAKEFVRANNLPIPDCMKSEEASEAYRQTRLSQLKQPAA